MLGRLGGRLENCGRAEGKLGIGGRLGSCAGSRLSSRARSRLSSWAGARLSSGKFLQRLRLLDFSRHLRLGLSSRYRPKRERVIFDSKR